LTARWSEILYEKKGAFAKNHVVLEAWSMVAKFYVEDEVAFSLEEESSFFRLQVVTAEIKEQHVEEFLDTTVEWLSTNPHKGILIDFKGVKYICSDFAIHLLRYYEDIKGRGLPVRFVNVHPAVQPSLEVTNITVVADLERDRVRVSAREILEDLSKNLSDRQLMDKHGLSERGLGSMFRKLLRKGLVTRRELARRLGVETSEITIVLEGLGDTKTTVDAGEVLNDIADDMTDDELMQKYKLSPKGLRSLFRKLYRRGLISKEMLRHRKQLSEQSSSSNFP
jgi:anti-anti-sigma regulatory factor/transcription initiation factor IIE alpha subunit